MSESTVTVETPRGVRLLSLDGGGIRGVSELDILHEVMVRIQHREGLANLPRPCEYFDLIGGTSTGGLIAILLGRLRLTTEQALAEYADLAGDVFGVRKSRWVPHDGCFSATRLTAAIKHVVQKYGADGNPDELMRDTRTEGVCKTFVCAANALNIGCPELLRTYSVPRTSIECTIWEAARATSAAPTFFKRIKIGRKHMEQEFIDAALGCNNPSMEVLKEADIAFGPDRKVDCLLSIGTGQKGVIGLVKPDRFQKLLPTNAIPMLIRLTTDAEITNDRVHIRFRNNPGVYFRLNVSHGMQNITLEEWKRIGEVRTHTANYLKNSQVSAEVDDIIDAILGKKR